MNENTNTNTAAAAISIDAINFHVTAKSSNGKTGPIAVTTTDRATCPTDCPFYRTTCYAEGYHLSKHWDKVTCGERGNDIDAHCATLEALPASRMLRLNQAGDLPGDGKRINADAAEQLLTAAARNGRTAWTYTHYTTDARNIDDVQRIADNDTPTAVVNLSGNDLAHVDTLPATLPRVTVTDSMDKVQRTPNGTKVVLCPAQSSDDVTCGGGRVKTKDGWKMTRACGNGNPLCARADRNYVVGFYAHGNKAKSLLIQLSEAK